MAEPCVKQDKIDRLEKDVININDRLNRHSEKIDKISDNNLVLETILKRLEDDGKEQKQINTEMQKTMVSIQGAMAEITFNIKELNTKLVETDKKVDATDEKVSEMDNDNKINIMSGIKSKLIPFLFGGGAVGLIIYAISQISKLL